MPDALKTLVIDSYKGAYSANFCQDMHELCNAVDVAKPIFLADKQVINLHGDALVDLLDRGPIVKIEAFEDNKSLEKMPEIMDQLLCQGIRRGDTLVVIGGGIVQDIGCYIASTLFRGLEWVFLPTTLLAQADSCIGSKSSINMLGHKNIVGTFNPPREVHVCAAFLESLNDIEMRSGIGEMLKVHMLDSITSLEHIVRNYDQLISDRNVLMSFLYASLEIKKRFIEVDEFDRGVRNLLNYGHSFGHAIEGATDFRVPHGIAVTMGMDIANYVSVKMGLGSGHPFTLSHQVFQQNYHGFEGERVPMDGFRASLEKDKKNIGNMLTLILPDHDDKLDKMSLTKTDEFWQLCETFFGEVRTS